MSIVKVKVENNVLDFLNSCSVKVLEKPTVVKVSNLVRPMFIGNDFICKKYFTNEKGHACYNCRAILTKKMYEEGFENLKKKPKDAEIYAKNSVYETASPYYKDKVLSDIMSKDFGMKIDVKGRETDEEYFRYNSFIEHFVYDEDLFREREEKEIEIHYENLDYELYEELYKLVFKAIRKRLVMLLELEGVVPLLNNIRKYMCDAGNPTVNMNTSMKMLSERIRSTLMDSEVQKWLESGVNDYTVYALDENTKQDYINTYQKVLRQISGIYKEPLEYMRDIIHNECDTLEDEIIANEMIELESFHSNLDYEEDDE